MSKSKMDYAAYIAYQSSGMQVYSLFVALTFTVITLLLTLVPNPTQIMSQAALFFLTILFDIFLYLTFTGFLSISNCADAVPPIREGKQRNVAITNFMYIFSLFLWGAALVLMFLLWDLGYLALASGLVYTLFVGLLLVYVYIPITKRWKELRSRD